MTFRILHAAGIISILIPVLLIVSTGPLQAAWNETGRSVCTAAGNQWYPAIIRGDADNTLLIWQDYRSGSGNVYVQKIDGGGDAQWSLDGVAACTDPAGREFFRQAISDGSGGAILAWTDHRTGFVDIFVQRVNSEGVSVWSGQGVQVSTSSGNDYYPGICSDGEGGVLLAWQRGLDETSVIRVQKVNGSGEPQWTSGGVDLSIGSGQFLPVVSEDGSGGMIVMWVAGDASASTIMAQRVSSAGQRMWGEPGVVVCSPGVANSFPVILGDAAGGCTVVWEDLRNGRRDIYSQRLDGDGDLLWDPEGVHVSISEGEKWFPQAVRVTDGSVIVVWVDARNDDSDIYAQKIGSDGDLLWSAGGNRICGAAGHQLNPRMDVNSGNDIFIVWQDGRGDDYDIYAQCIDVAGMALWDIDGQSILSFSDDQRLPEIIADDAGGALVTWEQYDGDSDIYSQRIDSEGHYLATTLAGFTADARDDAIEVVWTMNESEPEMVFDISRQASGESIFGSLAIRPDESAPETFAFRDVDIEPGVEYRYRVSVTGSEGTKLLFETEPLSIGAGANIVRQNYPNPFNPVTTIGYYLAADLKVELTVYDASGRRIIVLEEGTRPRGTHEVVWNGTDIRGNRVSSGVYFYRLRAGKDVFTKKMVLLR
ncbi:MAG: T9SS type A sorting domain-containing protein [Candidatus Krumholzibacteria bacterium]|nr:T9SS type A sorting domain-containing protein [Candidatus Krumholzibacteria bacterium]